MHHKPSEVHMEQNEPPRTTQATQRLLRLPAVEEITGVKKSTVYALVKSGGFPAPVRLHDCGRAVAWRDNDIADWVSSRVKVGVSQP